MKPKITIIIGARPQFIKAFALQHALSKSYNVSVIHSGQHYDYRMSALFFKELHLKKPSHFLNVGSTAPAAQTAEILSKTERILLDTQPNLVMVVGDTNTTIAGALAAAKHNIPICHIEAGMRSFNRTMPEEINRIVTDHISTLHFCSSKIASSNLLREGIDSNVHVVGDTMIDALRLATPHLSMRASQYSQMMSRPYLLLTIHRQSNADNKENLIQIFSGLRKCQYPILFPVHPRTMKNIQKFKIKHQIPPNIVMIEPQSYFEMLRLQKHAYAILTDSGGIQKEAYFLRVPCITLRNETEWLETVHTGWNSIVGTDSNKIANAIKKVQRVRQKKHPILYGDGHSSEKICDIITKFITASVKRTNR